MQQNDQNQNVKIKNKKEHKKHWILISISAVVIILLIIIFALPAYISSQAGENLILSKVNQSLDKGKVDFQNLSVGWLKGIQVDDVTYEEAQTNQVVRIDRIATKPNYSSFIFGAQTLAQTSVIVDGNDAAKPAMVAKSSSWKLKNTTGDIEVQLDDLALKTLQPLLGIADVNMKMAGIVNGTIQGRLEQGNIENLKANIDASNLDVTLPAEPNQQPKQIKAEFLNADVSLQRQGQTMQVETLDIKTDWASASLAGTVPLSIEAMADFLKAASPYQLQGRFNLNLVAFLAQTAGLIDLKEDMQITSGKISGNIDTVTAQAGKKISAQATLSDLAGNVAGKQVALTDPVNMETLIHSADDQVVLDKFNLDSSFVTINASGPIDNLKFQSSANLVQLQNQLGQFVDMAGYQFQGQVTKQGEISYTEDKIAVNTTGQITGLKITSPNNVTVSEEQVQTAFAGTLNQEENIFSAQYFTIDAGFGKLNLRDIIIPLAKKEKTDTTLKLSAENLDLAKLQQYARLTGAIPEDLELAGILQAQVSAQAQNTNFHIVTDNARIQNLMISSADQPQPFQQQQVSVDFDGYIDPVEKTAEIKNFQLRSDGINIKTNFKKTVNDQQTNIQGNVDAQYNWQNVSQMVSPFLPAGLQITGQETATINFASQYPVDQPEKLMDNLNTQASFGFDSAKYLGLNFGPTILDIAVDSGLLSLKPFTTKVNNGNLTFGGSADFDQSPTVFKIDQPKQVIENVRIDDVVAESLLQYLNPIFANAVNVSGLANLRCRNMSLPISPVDVNLLFIDGTVSIDQMQLQASNLFSQILTITGQSTSENVTIHPTEFVVRDGLLKYDRMQIDIGSTPLIFSGTVSLIDESLQMNIDYKGTTLSLTGTVTEPKLDTGKILQNELQKRLEKEIFKGLDKFL